MLIEKQPFVDFIELRERMIRITVPLLAYTDKLEARIEELETKAFTAENRVDLLEKEIERVNERVNDLIYRS